MCADEDEVFKSAMIFKKETTRPLTDYQKRINEEAGKLALTHPELLSRRGELLEKAQELVVMSGYTFKKGKSRSRKFSSPEPVEAPRRVKISADIRRKRMRALEEDISTMDEQLKFKMNRRQQAEAERKYKLCEEITEELSRVKQAKREKANELSVLQSKEKKALWYKKRKESTRSHTESTGGFTSDESDFPLSSPNSSMASTRSGFVSLVSDDEESESSVNMLAVEQHSGSEQPHFPPSLPVHNH